MSLFGSRDWSHVHREITKRVKRKFPRAGEHNIEDAVQTAVMNLYVVWRNYPGTKRVDDTQRLFAFAVMWGTGRAQQYLIQELRRHDRELSLDYPIGDPSIDDEEAQTLKDVIPDWRPTPEEDAMVDAEADELHRVIEQMSDEDLRSWLLPIAKGEGVVSQARRECLHHSTIQQRRTEGLRKLRAVLCA